MVTEGLPVLFLVFVFGQSLWLGNARSQDFASLLDVAEANGESLQNYDVSYRKTAIADLPKDRERLRAIKTSLENRQALFWDEKEEIGRLVIDKESSSNPKKMLFVKRVRIYAQGKVVQQYTRFLVWDNGESASGNTMNPSGEIGRGKSSLEKCYSSFLIPSFETYNGSLLPPKTKGYWEDHSVFWEWYKSQTADVSLVRLPNGRLRSEKTFATHRNLSEYDPKSSLVVFYTTIPIDQESGNEKPEFSMPARVTWKNHRNVYCLKGVISRGIADGIMSDDVETFYWHQCNEERVVFPSEVLKDFTLERCTQFLIDGQSELSEGK